ncbi:alpha-amylase family glycosyl hydrolase [Alteromonas flava]|uniref:alpha-amylase family glycosyl hydrolase n=1 Tax=Alteromonas flava TaxID=2048003 RepID=UPI000C2901F8|nr:alpha-amylase family glycosyl hydrolase [Alteromonas flava]
MSIPRFPVAEYSHVVHPEWSYAAGIYQINTRQFSLAGDFVSIIPELPRIKRLGADILWLMPIHPIGEKKRKGLLGSPYAVKDYRAINPEFGDADQFHKLVDAIHQHDMKVIIDWVPNHSAWDNPLVKAHPEWYATDHKGDFRPSPWWDWSDIIEFDYRQPGLREYMIEAMCYWISTFDIDGFRCDVAGYVPNDFWRQARQTLDAIKPVFMLAEWEARDLHEYAFDMTYAWTWNEVMHGIAAQKVSLNKLRQYYSWNERAWPRDAMRMTFVSNHDKNAWDGTQYEQFGEALDAAIVLSVLGEGMPLIHNGQEAGETKRLAFFERDPIDWQAHYIGDLYAQLLALKKTHSPLHNGNRGATMLQVENTQMDSVFSFVRQDPNYAVLVVLNLSPSDTEVTLQSDLVAGTWSELRLQTKIAGAAHHSFANDEFENIDLLPWQARVWVKG